MKHQSKSTHPVNVLGMVFITFLLTACGEEKKNLPKTFEAYQGKTAFDIKDLNETDKAALYQNSYSQNNELGQKVTLPIFNECLDTTLREHSSFMSFYKIYKICESKALKDQL